MNIEINIECEDYKDLIMHLSVIRQQITKAFKERGDSIEIPIEISDNNCYGWHEIKITEPA